MKKRYILIILGIIFILAIVIISMNYNKVNETISKILLKQEKMEAAVSMRIDTHELQGKNAI